MRLTVQHHHLRSTAELDSLIEDRILSLQPRLQIDEASVRLAFRYEQSPAFQVKIHLATPGPDVMAEGCDHTIRAAIEKAMTEVETKLVGRVLKRGRRVRSNLHSPRTRRMERLQTS